MNGRTAARSPLRGEKKRLYELYVQGQKAPSWQPAPKIGKAPAGSRIPLSFEQELIWAHSQLAPDLPLYNEILTIRRTGALDVPVLERALSEVLRRHEAWRTTFDTVDGIAVQIVQPPTAVRLPVVDLSGLAEPARLVEAARIATEEVRRPLDLVRGPVVRCKLVRLSPAEHRLYVVVHQIVHDGVSVYSVLLPELVSLYEAFAAGRPSPLPEPEIQYGDFASAERREHEDEALEPSLEYWRQQLQGAPTALELPTDHGRPSVQTFRGCQHSFALSRSLTDALKRFSQREGVTLFVTLLAAFETLLHRYTGQDDIVVGTAISTRRQPEVEKLLGVFLNTIVVRARLSEGQTFRSLLASQKAAVLEGLSHGEVPFHRLVKHLQPKRDPARNPIFQVTFVLEPPMPPPMPGWEMTQMDVDTGVARVDLYLQMDDRPEGLVGHIRWCADLWERATIERLAERFETLLQSVVNDPDRSLSSLPLLAPGDRRRLSGPHAVLGNESGRFARSEIDQSIAQRFATQAAKHADRIAIRTKTTTWSYAELDRARRKVARALENLHPEPGSRVALLLDHDAPMVAGILGTLTSGYAYVPLDAAHPAERLRKILNDAQPTAILTSSRNAAIAGELATDGSRVVVIDTVLEGPEPTGPDPVVSPDALAYVLYTSGSTGQPKGVAQNHRNVLHFISAYTNNLHLRPDDRLTLIPSYGVDAAVMDIFAATLNGATLCPIEVRQVGLPGVIDALGEFGVTVYHSTPTLFRHVTRELGKRRASNTVRLVVLGGEEVRPSDVEACRKHFAPGCIFVNGFGPTESTVTLQYFVDGDTPLRTRSVPIGRPVESTEVSLLSRAGVPGQVYGEIAIRSSHVALGYWQNPELTRAAFGRSLPGVTERVYKTGDMGRLLPDGDIEYCGRRDLQTKISGFRVELGEVEATLLLHPDVTEAAAAVREVAGGDKQLVAYFSSAREPAPAPEDLRRFLRGRLPVHMVPALFVRLDRMPWTTSGKIDRLALPTPQPAAPSELARPQDKLEERLAAIWRRVLGLDRIGVDQDFFELGGHSMMALQMMAQIDSEFGINLPLGTLFEAPTVRRLADLLRSEGDLARSSSAHASARPRVGLVNRLLAMAARVRSLR